MRLPIVILVAAAVVALAFGFVARGHVTGAPAATPDGWKWGDGRSS
jgi:hypothetical protein